MTKPMIISEHRGKLFRIAFFYASIIFIFHGQPVTATNWQVGAGRAFTLPSQVSTLVQNADTVTIDAGIYPADVCRWQADSLLLRSGGGLAHLQSNGLSYGDKAIWVIDGVNTTVEWIEFSGCTSTSHNGAGIRQEAENLVVRHCYFHNNEDGILSGAYPGKITIEFSEFGYNGYGDGFSHNLYIGHTDTLMFRFNYSHHCHIGHELKSRASVNIIYCNRISNEALGDASREIDLPNGGTAVIIGNEIEQGPNSQNSNIIGFGLEGLSNPAPHELYLSNNTIVNDRSSGSFVQIQNGTSLYKCRNTIFAGNGTVLNGTALSLDTSSNLVSAQITSFNFYNTLAYDYRLTALSPCIDAGVNPGSSSGGDSLLPADEYVHPHDSSSRNLSGLVDIGAYEYPSTITGVPISPLQTPLHISYMNRSICIDQIYVTGLVQLFDMTGKCCLQQKIHPGENTFSLHSMQAGLYIISILQPGSFPVFGKILIPE